MAMKKPAKKEVAAKPATKSAKKAGVKKSMKKAAPAAPAAEASAKPATKAAKPKAAKTLKTPKAAKPKAAKAPKAAKPKAVAVKLTKTQDEILLKVHSAGDAGYKVDKKTEEKSLEALQEKKLVKKGKKDKADGKLPYHLSALGKKHLESSVAKA